MSMMRGHIEAKAKDRDMLAAAYAAHFGKSAPEPTAAPVLQIKAEGKITRKTIARQQYSRNKGPTEKRAAMAAQIPAMRAEGLSQNEIARRLNTTRVTLRKAAREAGCPFTEQDGVNGKRTGAKTGAAAGAIARAALCRAERRMQADTIEMLLGQGKNRREISEHMGVSRGHVTTVIREFLPDHA